MRERRIGILMNGVTGRMGANQHLMRSIVEIIRQGGVQAGGETIMPVPVLAGRSEERLRPLADRVAEATGGEPPRVTTDIAGAIADPASEIVFDASTTQHRPRVIEMAAEAGKALYCEKPIATTLAEALRLAAVCESSGIKNGVVHDKLWLPGLLKLRGLIERGFFGRILSIRGDFGYWVFSGHDAEQPPQRPSWNYRAEDGGGIISDMYCHWRYVLDGVFGDVCGPVTRLASWANVDLPERIDEQGKAYPATAEDSAYAMFLLGNSVMAQFNSSWCTRVRRDDLLTIQVDGTEGSAVAGLRECCVQTRSDTPRPVWNPDIPQAIDFYEGWTPVEPEAAYDNAFKAQWELFLRHVVADEPFPWSLREGAKGVQLAELGLRASSERAWVDVPELS